MVRKYDFVGSRPIQLICTGSEAHNHIAFSLTIKGEAAQKTVIVDNRGLNLPTFFIESEGNLILDGLTITRGTTGPPSRGGIINRGTLNVKNSKIENSRADQGVGAGI